jgi:hypothetical protein
MKNDFIKARLKALGNTDEMTVKAIEGLHSSSKSSTQGKIETILKKGNSKAVDKLIKVALSQR